MKIRATVTKNGFIRGVEYDLNEEEATNMIIRGEALEITVAPAYNREKAILQPDEKRWHTK